MRNPLQQNEGHIRALADLLGLPRSVFHNLVFLTGTATLKNGPISGVLDTGWGTHIKSFRIPVLTEAQVSQSLDTIRQASLSALPGAKAAHIAQLSAKSAKRER